MEEIMSDFISAIKRFIENWVDGKPKLVHYETVQHNQLQRGVQSAASNS
jgi:hypothetical protein